MKRCLLNLLTALSLLLCVAAVALWVRSYWHFDKLTLWRNRPSAQSQRSDAEIVTVGSMPGRVLFAAVRVAGADARWFEWAYSDTPSIRDPGLHLAGGGWAYNRRATRQMPLFTAHYQVRDASSPWTTGNGGSALGTERSITVPHWLLILLTAVAPLAWLRSDLARRHRRRRVRHNLCPRCGYDLRATPERCPECGATP
jgi:hypothetical protein